MQVRKAAGKTAGFTRSDCRRVEVSTVNRQYKRKCLNGHRSVIIARHIVLQHTVLASDNTKSKCWKESSEGTVGYEDKITGPVLFNCRSEVSSLVYAFCTTLIIRRKGGPEHIGAAGTPFLALCASSVDKQGMFAPAYDSAGSTSEELDDSLSVLRGADWSPPPSVDAAIVDALTFDFDRTAEPLFHQQHGAARRHVTRNATMPAFEPSPEPQFSSTYSADAMAEIDIPGAANMTPSQLKRARRSAIEKKSRQRRQVRDCGWLIGCDAR